MQAILDLDTQVHARLKHYGEMQNCDVKCFCSKKLHNTIVFWHVIPQ